MLPNPVCARCGGGEAGGDAVAGRFNMGEEDVDFRHDAGHIYALVVCFNVLVIAANTVVDLSAAK